MAFGKQIIEEAKKLYLEIDEEGERKYSLRDISEILKEKFNQKVSRQAIQKWRDKFGWENELKQKVLTIAERQLEPVPSGQPQSQDDKLKEIISRAKNRPLLSLIRLSEKLDRTVKDMSPDDKRFPRLAEVATKTFVALHEIMSKMENPADADQKAIIIINEINTRGDRNG